MANLYAYVAANVDNALSIIDVTDPTNPLFSGVLRGGGAEPWLNGARCVFVAGDYAYVTASGDNALVIADVTDPTNPFFKGVLRGGGAEPWLGGPYGVLVPSAAAAGIAGLNPALMKLLSP